MNPFETNASQDFLSLLELTGDDILVNDTPAKAVITNYNLIGESEDKNLHTATRINRGDTITYQTEPYIIINETFSKRHAKFKTLMRHCNHTMKFKGILEEKTVIIGYDPRGRPIYGKETVEGEPIYVNGIVSSKTFNIDETKSIRIVDKQIVFIVQNNETNREKLKVNTEHLTLNGNYKVLDHDHTLKGLLLVRLESIAMPTTV